MTAATSKSLRIAARSCNQGWSPKAPVLVKGENHSARIRIIAIMSDQRRHHRGPRRLFNPNHRCSERTSTSLVHPRHHLHEVLFLGQSQSPNNGIPHPHQFDRCHYKNQRTSTTRDYTKLNGGQLLPATPIKDPTSSTPCNKQENAKTLLPLGTQTSKWKPTNSPHT
jgi:hypothetical protein